MRLVGTVLYMGSAFAVYTDQPGFSAEDLIVAVEPLADGGAAVFDGDFRLLPVDAECPAPAELETFGE